MGRSIDEIQRDLILRRRLANIGVAERGEFSPAQAYTAVNVGSTMAGMGGSGFGSVSNPSPYPSFVGLPERPASPPTRATSKPESRTAGASELPVMDEDDQSIVALARSLLDEGVAIDMPSALQMAREYASDSRAQHRQDMDASRARADAAYGQRQAQRAEARGVVPEDGQTGADVRFANKPTASQEATVDFQQDAADNVTRGLRDGSIDEPGSQAWNEQSAYNYAQDHGIDSAEDAEIVRFLTRRLRREPRPDEVEEEKNWRKWVNENPGSERQAQYNPAGWNEWWAERNRVNNEADRKKYGPPTGVSTIDPKTGEWTKPLSVGDLTPEQVAARNRRADLQKNAAERDKPNRLARLRRRAGLSPEQAAGKSEQELRELGDDRRASDLEFRTQRRLEGAYLAGGSHNISGQGQGVINRLMSLPPEQRVRALLYSGPGGHLAAQVDAQGLQNIMRLLNAEALAGADPFNRMLRQQQQDAQRRKEDPAWAGDKDMAEGRVHTPEAVQEQDRLAEQFDSGGWNTMSWEDEARLADLFMQKYKIDRATAEELANRAANKRRWTWLQGKPAAPGAEPPPGPAAGEMPAVSM